MSLQEIKAAHADLLELYREIRSEPRRSSYSNLDSFISQLSPLALTPMQRGRLWDNFAHYLWVDPQEDEIGLITAILVADKFLNAFADSHIEDVPLTRAQEHDLRRIAHAHLVLPIPIDNRVPRTTALLFSAQQRALLEIAHDRFVQSIELHLLEANRNEIVFNLQRARAAAAKQSQLDRKEKELRLRESLTSLNLGSASERIVPTMLASLETLRSPPPPVLADDIRETLSSEAKMVLAGMQGVGGEVAPAIALLNDKIATMQVEADSEIETSFATTYVALGTEISYEERIPPGSIIVKATPAEAGGYNYDLSYFHGRQRTLLQDVTGTISNGETKVVVRGARQPTQHPDFQTFRLTDTPITGIRANLSLRLVPTDGPVPPTQLETFSVFDAMPHFDVPAFGEIDELTAQPPPLFGVNKLGLVDYRRVEQELACYVTGEVSRIENILASEFKERVSRSLNVLERETEAIEELSAERQTDTETSQKLEMQAEASSVISEETSKAFDVGAGVSINLPANAGNLTTSASFNYNTSSSRQDSNSEAIDLARSITNRIQEKITQKVTSRRRSLSRQEFEDINKHGFDNRQGEEHVVGVYRWIDKILDNHLVNYGRRCVIEFQIPEPARNLIRAQENSVPKEDFGKRRPRNPKLLGMRRPASVKPDNYRRFASYYGLSVPEPPAESITVARGFADSPVVGEDDGAAAAAASLNRSAAYNEIEVPVGYLARKATIREAYFWEQLDPGNPWGGIGQIYVSVGDSYFATNDDPIELPDLTSTVPVGVLTVGVSAYVVNVSVECRVDERLFQRWQLDTYNTILNAYREQKAEYDNALEDHKAKQQSADLNPRFKQQLMEKELKRICIEMLTRPFNVDVTADHYGPAEEGALFPLKLSPALDKHAATVRFFEQAFDWQLMAYIFYPYFYSDEKTWSVKLGMEMTRSEIFEAFLTSGMSRAVVPIRKGFEDAVMYYLQTGEVWFGAGFVLDVKNDLYLSIADEMMTGSEETTIEYTWQSKLPTNLTILQSRSAALTEEGLPCKIESQKIGVGSSSLSPVLPSPETP